MPTTLSTIITLNEFSDFIVAVVKKSGDGRVVLVCTVSSALQVGLAHNSRTF